jgi:DNA-binding transcriptional LysR family regulator
LNFELSEIGLNLIDRINLNHLRVFEAVYRSRSMTKAARDLHLTQSGISQHIRALEDNLGVKLFDRYKQKIIPTGVANVLFNRCEESFSGLEQTLWQITEKNNDLSGLVKVGMPTEFGCTLILPIISKFLRRHPLVQVELTFGFSHEITSEVISGNLDFAYVDDFTKDHRITIERVNDQVIELVGSARYLKGVSQFEHKKAWYEGLAYIAYMQGEPVLRSWFKFHLRSSPILNVRAYCASPTSVLRLIQEDLGVGVVPRYMVQQLGKAGNKLVTITGSNKELLVPISVAYLAGKSHSHAAYELSKTIGEELGILTRAGDPA